MDEIKFNMPEGDDPNKTSAESQKKDSDAKKYSIPEITDIPVVELPKPEKVSKKKKSGKAPVKAEKTPIVADKIPDVNDKVPEVTEKAPSVIDDLPIPADDSVKAPPYIPPTDGGNTPYTFQYEVAETPKSKGPLIIFSIIAAIIVIIGVIIAVNFKLIYASIAPDAFLAQAATKTTAAIDSRFKNSPYSAFSFLSPDKKVYTSKIHGETTIPYSQGINISVVGDCTTVVDTENEQNQSEITLNVNGFEIPASIYSDKEEIILSSAILNNGQNYGSKYDVLASAINAATGHKMSADGVESLQSSIDYTIGNASVQDMTENYKPYAEEIAKFMKKIKPKASYANVIIGGKEEKCIAVSYSFTQAELAETIENLKTLIRNDEEIKEALTAQGMNGSDAEEYYNDLIDDICGKLDKIGSESNIAYNVTFYVSDKGYLSGCSSDINGTTADDEKFEASIKADLGANPASAPQMSLTATVPTDYNGTSQVTMIYTSSDSANEYSDHFEMSEVSSDDYTTAASSTIISELKWNKTTGAYTADISSGSGNSSDPMKISCSGTINYDKTFYELSIDKMTLPGEEDNESLNDFKYSMRLEDGGKISKPDSYKDISQWSESDTEAIGNIGYDLAAKVFGFDLRALAEQAPTE